MAAETCGCVPTPRPDPSTERSEPVCYCPIDDLIETVSRKYAMQIVTLVGAEGPLRFGDLEAELPGASTSTLSDRLQELVEAGFLERESFDEVPPHVEYTLTPAGRELEARLQPLLEWASEEDLSASAST